MAALPDQAPDLSPVSPTSMPRSASSMIQLIDKQSLRRLGVARRQLLEEVDRPALKALPSEPYEYSEWRVRWGRRRLSRRH